MNILLSNNKMSLALQQGLAEFGIDRQRAIDGTADMKGSGPKYFGISHSGKEAEMYFPKDINELGNRYGMDMAVVVPSGTDTFDLLRPAFGAQLNMKEPKTIRNYLRKLLESI